MATEHRRLVGPVTPNACNPCRRRHAKCDGEQPCKRCAKGDVSDCTYSVQHNLAKDEMRLEITRLRQGEISSTRILNALASNHQTPQILQRLANREDLEDIARDIKSTPVIQHNDNLKIVAKDLTLQVGPDNYSLLPTTTNQIFDSSIVGETSYQTATLPDPPLLGHLLSLYTIWIHPQYPLFSMPDFLKDYGTGGTTQCSTFLVAAICAAASHFLNPHWDSASGMATDVARLRQSLITQAEIQEGLAEPNAETTAHALAVMLIVNSHSVQRYNVGHVPAEMKDFSSGGT